MNLNKIFLQIILAAATLSTILVAPPEDYKKVVIIPTKYGNGSSWVFYGNLLAKYEKTQYAGKHTLTINCPTGYFSSQQQPKSGIITPITQKKLDNLNADPSDEQIQKEAFKLFDEALQNQPWLKDKFDLNETPTFVSDYGYSSSEFTALNKATNKIKSDFAAKSKVKKVIDELNNPTPSKSPSDLKKMIEELSDSQRTEITDDLGDNYEQEYKARYQEYKRSLKPVPAPAPIPPIDQPQESPKSEPAKIDPAPLAPPTQQDPAPLAPPIQQEPAPAPTPVTEVPKIDNPAPAPLAPPTNVDPIPAPTTNIDPNPTPNGGNGGGGNNGGDLFGTLCKGTVVVAVLYFVARLAQSGIQKKTASKNEPKPVGKKNNIIEEE